MHGTEDVITAVFQIILGKSIGVDVLGVHDGCTGAFLRYTVSLLGYGFHGDIIEPSESLRWMGPERYNIVGTWNWLKLASYRGRISFLPSTSSGHPLDSNICSSSCPVCAKSDHESECEFATDPPNSSDNCIKLTSSSSGKVDLASDCGTEDDTKSVDDVSNTHAERLTQKLIKSNGLRYQKLAINRVESTPVDFSHTTEDGQGRTSLPNGWRTLSGSFVAINAFPISCRCAKSPQGPAPTAHLGDGCVDLVVVRKCTRHSFLQFLLMMAAQKRQLGNANGLSSVDHLRLPFVEVYRVRALEFEPLDANGMPFNQSNGQHDTEPFAHSAGALNFTNDGERSKSEVSVWCVDGEVLYQAHISCWVHRQLIQVFGQGPEE